MIRLHANKGHAEAAAAYAAADFHEYSQKRKPSLLRRLPLLLIPTHRNQILAFVFFLFFLTGLLTSA